MSGGPAPERDYVVFGVVDVPSRAKAPPPYAAHAALIGANALWSGWNVGSRALISSGTDAIVFATYREVLCATLLCGLALAARCGYGRCCDVALHTFDFWQKLTRRDLLLFVTSGGCLFLFQLAFLFGVGLVSANAAGLSILLVPLTTLVLSAALGLEQIGVPKLAGVACACAGCALVVLVGPTAEAATEAADDAGSGHAGSGHAGWAQGCVLLLLSGVGTSIFVLGQRPLLDRFAELDVVAGCYSVAAVVALSALGAYKGLVRPDARLSVTPSEGLSLCLASVLVGVLAYSLFTYANRWLPATLVTLYGILQPLLTSLLAYTLLGETPSTGTLLGGALLVLGLLLTTWAERAAASARRVRQ